MKFCDRPPASSLAHGTALLARGYRCRSHNLNEYYDVTLKQARLARLTGMRQFPLVKLDLAD